MKQIILLMSLCISTLHIVTAQPQFKTQAQHTCADSRLLGTTRMAVATQQHMQLMNMYDVTFYGLDLALERNSAYITGSVTTHATVKSSPLSVFAFELHPSFTIESVTINGAQQSNLTRNGSDVSVNLSTIVAAKSKVVAVINYSGNAPNGGNAAIGNGFNTARVSRWGNDVTWSLSEPYAAYEWWPTKQVLTDKADSVHVAVTTSAENKVGSNGLLTNTLNLPNGKVRYEWESRYPIDYYLISVAVSDYDEYVQFANPAGAAKPVPVVNYIYKGSLDTYKNQIDFTPPLIEHFSELFTLYPFAAEKYGHSMAPIGGGMEHQTMTTQSTFTFTLTAHELAHQWFGDNVTCASWQDIWLNEGFASYAEYLGLQHYSADAAQSWMTDAHNRARSATQGSLRVPDTTNVGRIFNYSLTYKKGAAVVHMLRYEINNDALFFKALQNYQIKFGSGTASTADLQRVMEQTTGKKLGYFFKQWYEGEGYPVFNVAWNQRDRKMVLVSEQATTGKTPFFRTDITYQVQTTSGTETFRVRQTKPTQQFVFTVDGEVLGVTMDPENWILKEVNQIVKNSNLPVPDFAPIVSPNPVSGNFATITDLNFTPTTVVIFDRIGRKMGTQTIVQQENIQLQVSTLPAGLYFVQFSDGQQTRQVKFVKL
ncbi:M1 family aminopeptidase [Pontibacter populi]|uniref:Aminopeptidase N n=1 Tax=Pontibacter populi TaxID=890055 RepID=A0ABV1RZT6_9BACT